MMASSEYQRTEELIRDIETVAAAGRAAKDGTPWSEDAKLAFGRFYDYFFRRAYAYCRRAVAHKLPRDMEFDAFITGVFDRLTRDLHRLRLPAMATAEHLKKVVLFYIHRQAGWALSELRDETQPNKSADAYIMAKRLRDHLSEEESSTEFTQKKIRLSEVMERCNAKDRDILETSFRHQDLETGEFLLPEGERDRLCREWKFNSPNALTVYRRRKIKELRQLLCA
jgi:hypothetical protein